MLICNFAVLFTILQQSSVNKIFQWIVGRTENSRQIHTSTSTMTVDCGWWLLIWRINLQCQGWWNTTWKWTCKEDMHNLWKRNNICVLLKCLYLNVFFKKSSVLLNHPETETGHISFSALSLHINCLWSCCESDEAASNVTSIVKWKSGPFFVHFFQFHLGSMWSPPWSGDRDALGSHISCPASQKITLQDSSPGRCESPEYPCPTVMEDIVQLPDGMVGFTHWADRSAQTLDPAPGPEFE